MKDKKKKNRLWSGEFKLKPKDLKPYADVLKEKIPNFKEHYSHMKEAKHELKEQREQEESDYENILDGR